MAGTATHLHTVPTPAPVAVRRRGNHPAGRALVAAGARPSARPVVADERVAVVVPLHRRSADVVPLSSRRPDRQVAAAPAPLRLTRRGRRVVVGLGLGVVVALSAAVGSVALGPSGGPALELAGRSTVVVHSGDTLWSIAQSLAPDADPREVVDALQAVNGLTDSSLVPGQVLQLP